MYLLLLPLAMHAQVTTGSVTGTVKTPDGKGMEGATVIVTHTPSGTRYTNVSRKNGGFTLAGLRVGGPYALLVQFVGYKPQTVEGFNISLGDPYNITITLGEEDIKMLEGVEIRSAGRKGATEKSGASTTFNSRMLTTLPSYNRSITDFTRLTPQSNGGNSFAGRSGYYNNLKVDGANLNNNFGLSTDPLPGGGAQPISLDAFDEVSVNIAPVDVRQSGFTGAGINAVTKSGTNEFHGSAFGYYRNQSFNGRNVGDTKLDEAAKSSRTNYGASLGGPIIKNKLFFFINGEYEKNSGQQISNFVPANSSHAGNQSDVPLDSLAKLAQFLKDKYNYDPGAYDGYGSADKSNYKYLVKLDWNINNNNKLTAKFSDFVSNEEPSSINATSIIGGGGFSITGSTNSVSTLPNNRISQKAMTFGNSVYGFKHTVRTGTLELNSNYGRISNSLLLTASKIRDTRVTNSSPFPFVDIFDGSTATANNYLSFGYEPFSYNNDVINNIYSFTDNFTYYTGKHTLTAGVNYEYQLVGNMFMPGAQSYYAYNSLNDFMTGQAPLYYSYAYSLVPGEKAVYSAELKFGQLGLYAQDEINVTPKFKVTVGLRADKPVYLEKALENPAITALSLPDKDGNFTHYNGQWPNSRFILSPRVGARWDVLGDKSLILRGSMGIFNGIAPFVWLTNMPTNSGMYQNSVALKNTNPDDAKVLAGMQFNPNIDAYAGKFPPVAGTSVPTNIVVVDPNFKFPQVFRTDFAVDKSLGNGFNVTLEGMVTKDINAIWMRNANLKDATGLANGPDNRPRYISTAPSDRYLYPGISSAIVLENTSKGYSYAFTGVVSKNFAKGFYGSIAYTYTKAKDVTANGGSQAFSIWNSNPTIGTSNTQEMYNSSSAIPHRIVSVLSYRIEYVNHGATTLSLVYQGAPSGTVSYRLNGDMNGDGNNQDLLYVPKSAKELTFETYTATVGGVTYTYTPDQQAAAFDKFINNSSYLSKRRGQYTERNSALMPWYSNLSARFLQDFFIRTHGQQHTLQFSADILNLPNLLNKYWGTQQGTTTTQPLSFSKYDANGSPIYRMQNQGGVLYTKPFQDVISASSTWSLQLGLRYSF